MSAPTTKRLYRAFYKDNHAFIIFRDVAAGDVRARLPKGSRVYPDVRNTIGRLDGGDEYEFAMFEHGRRVIIVTSLPTRNTV
jgi:hypothetical protein